jgi:GAF domain-containing protein
VVPPLRLLPPIDPSDSKRARVSKRLETSGLAPDVFALLTERAVDVLSADMAAVGVGDAGGTSVTIDVVAGDPTSELFETTIPATAWRMDEVLHQGRSVVVADLGSSELHPSLVELGSIGPCLAMPLWGRLRPFGVLLAGRHGGAPPFSDRAVKDLQGLSGS